MLANYEPVLLLIITPGAPATYSYDAGQPLWSDSIYWRSVVDFPRDEGPKTDADGRIVVRDLIPGATYRISFHDKRGLPDEGYEFTVRSGETIDVGDVKIPLQD